MAFLFFLNSLYKEHVVGLGTVSGESLSLHSVVFQYINKHVSHVDVTVCSRSN